MLDSKSTHVPSLPTTRNRKRGKQTFAATVRMKHLNDWETSSLFSHKRMAIHMWELLAVCIPPMSDLKQSIEKSD